MKLKVESLTKEQTDKFPEYVDRWLKIGLSTEVADRAIAENALVQCYKLASLTPPKQILWTTSPLAGCVLIGVLKNEKLMSRIVSDLKKKNLSAKKVDLGASVWASVWASVRNSVRNSVGDSVRDSVRNSVRNSVGDSVWDSVGDSVRSVLTENGWYSYFGQFDAGAMAFFEYFREVCNLIEETQKAIPLWDLAKHSSWVYPYKNIAVLSEKPEIISVNKEGKIHCDGGPAIKYRDSFSVWGLNGVRVSQEIAETPADKLDPILVTKEKNVEVRREIVRKIGIDRIYEKLGGSVIDDKHGYKLINLNLGDGRTRPFLLMQNPSIDARHLEGVPPEIRTVETALAWRNQTDKYYKPKELT